MLYNIVTNDGERASVTVFMSDGRSFVATKDHPRFDDIVAAVKQGKATEQEVSNLFDISVALGREFTPLSERVSINAGRLFFDNVEVDDRLTQEIVRFHVAGLGDHRPLVRFMEKVAQNPLEHSRDNLFRWIEQHNFIICEDGDFIAWKGVSPNLYSLTAGDAIVNGTLVQGHIPNKPGTVVEMPRNRVQHDPRRACSTGLHVGNWTYARGFGPTTLRVKVNPRDVVSVPTDCQDQKMRVCRYRVVEIVQSEDPDLIFKGAERTARVAGSDPDPERKQKVPGKKRVKHAVTKAHKFPTYYEQFKRNDFDACGIRELRWLGSEWKVANASLARKDDLVGLLAKEARKRLRTWKKP